MKQYKQVVIGNIISTHSAWSVHENIAKCSKHNTKCNWQYIIKNTASFPSADYKMWSCHHHIIISMFVSIVQGKRLQNPLWCPISKIINWMVCCVLFSVHVDMVCKRCFVSFKTTKLAKIVRSLTGKSQLFPVLENKYNMNVICISMDDTKQIYIGIVTIT